MFKLLLCVTLETLIFCFCFELISEISTLKFGLIGYSCLTNERIEFCLHPLPAKKTKNKTKPKTKQKKTQNRTAEKQQQK